mgnify:CR=1 FL=1
MVKEKILLGIWVYRIRIEQEEMQKVSMIYNIHHYFTEDGGLAGILPAQGGTHRKSNSTANNQMGLKNQMGFSGATGNNMKFVKPSELNLDFINPNSNQRSMGVKGSHQLANGHGAGPSTSNHQQLANQNVQNILQNLRTPQN